MDDQNLLELVRQSKNGDAQALERLVSACQPAAFRLALSILDDPAEADDVTQEAFIKAIRSISAYREEARFQTWLYRIIVNSCLGRLRKRRTRQRLGQLLTDRFRHTRQGEALPERQAIQEENSGQVLQAVNSLDDDHRLPVILRYYQELPIAQIAEILDVSPRTVHTRLKQAHDTMREVLGEYDGND
jgi:RNA polymerase sigma-70 factor (ECF subfamily)